MSKRTPVCLFVLLTVYCHPAIAQAPSSTPLRPADGIFMGQNLVLTAAPTYQMTFHANVQQFEYQPGSDSIAYVSQSGTGDSASDIVDFIGVREDQETPQEIYSGGSGLQLLGWDATGQYLLIRDSQGGYVLGNVGTIPFSAQSCGTTTASQDGLLEPVLFAWSPGKHLVLLAQYADIDTSTGQGFRALSPTPPIYTLYNPASGKPQVITPESGLEIFGWLDEGHLLLERRPDFDTKPTEYDSYDLATGVTTIIPTPNPLPREDSPNTLELGFPDDAAIFSPVNPDLHLDDNFASTANRTQVAATPLYSVWVSNAKAPRSLSVLAISVTPGSDDPQAQWSPDGNSVAYIAHGDLFETNLSERSATPLEEVAAGEHLPCAQMQLLAAADLKLVGLAALEYTMDNHESYPQQAGWQAEIEPYLEGADASEGGTAPGVLELGNIPVIYHAPADLSLSDMNDPSSVVLATMDLPCAHIVLYADGHVKDFPKQGQDTHGDGAR